jgi:hypothetical protein
MPGGGLWKVPPGGWRKKRIVGGKIPHGVVNLYLTFLDDLFDVYLIGIQVDR